jgi:hypothetical protein
MEEPCPQNAYPLSPNSGVHILLTVRKMGLRSLLVQCFNNRCFC